MQRREVLRGAALAVTGMTVGLAGCGTTSDDGADPTPELVGDHPECVPPEGALAAALPTGEGFRRHSEVTTSDASHDDSVTRTAYALYNGPGGGEYYCSITEYESTAAAGEGTTQVRLEGGNSNAVLGLVQFDQYVYFGAGPDRERVRDLLGAAALDGACLDSAFRSLSGTATPEPL
jgi:hypothetical protein